MRKISIIITARSSYTKYRTILDHLKKYKSIKIDLVCSGSALIDKFGKIDKEIKKDGFKISKKINFILENDEIERPGKELGIALQSFSEYFKESKPDLITVMADRYEVLAPTIAAAFLNIPIAHIQGGEISGNIDEKVRHAITKLSNIHFPATTKSKKNILQMGEDPKSVFLTGCPSIDIAKKVMKNKKQKTFNLYKKYSGVGSFPNLDNEYIIVMQHPVTNELNQAGIQINETIEAMKKLNFAIIWFWPNVDHGTDIISNTLRKFREQTKNRNFHFIKNMNPFDFLELVKFSKCIVGNSSCAIRECSYLGVPAINIGTRQINRERGLNVVDVNYNRREIYNACLKQINNKIKKTKLYGDGTAGIRIAKVLTKINLSSDKQFTSI